MVASLVSGQCNRDYQFRLLYSITAVDCNNVLQRIVENLYPHRGSQYSVPVERERVFVSRRMLRLSLVHHRQLSLYIFEGTLNK